VAAISMSRREFDCLPRCCLECNQARARVLGRLDMSKPHLLLFCIHVDSDGESSLFGSSGV
jgi:phosphoribosyl-dephospho-CoA transferase